MKKRTLRDLVLAGAMAAGLGVAGCITSNEEENEHNAWYYDIDPITGLSCEDIQEIRDGKKQFTPANDEIAAQYDSQVEYCKPDYIDTVRFNEPVDPARVKEVLDSLKAIKAKQDKIVDPATSFSCNTMDERLGISTNGYKCSCRDLANYELLLNGNDSLAKECSANESTSHANMNFSDWEWKCSDSLIVYYDEMVKQTGGTHDFPGHMAFDKKRLYCALEQFAQGLRGQEIVDACADDYETFATALNEKWGHCVENGKQISCIEYGDKKYPTDFIACGLPETLFK